MLSASGHKLYDIKLITKIFKIELEPRSVYVLVVEHLILHNASRRTRIVHSSLFYARSQGR